MGKKFLMDSGCIIKYLNRTFPKAAIDFLDTIIDDESSISFVTEIELQAWSPAAEKDLVVYREFVEASEITGITKDIIKETIFVRKKSRIKLADAIIAATAIVSSQTLVADNDKDSLKVEELKYLNPKTIG